LNEKRRSTERLFRFLPFHSHSLYRHRHAAGTAATTREVELHGGVSLPKSRPQNQPTPIPQQAYAPTPPTPLQFQRQPKSISSFVVDFKSATVKRIDDWIDANQPTMAKFNKNNPLWQSNYYDHIIRDVIEYQYIAEYIVRNPMEWNDEESNEE
jgi:hypothetical protein